MQLWNIFKGSLKEMCETILDESPEKAIVTNVAKMITTERKWQPKKGVFKDSSFENVQLLQQIIFTYSLTNH